MRRKAAAAFMMLAVILLLIDVPTNTVVAGPPVPPPSAPRPTPAPTGVCDRIWTPPKPGFRFMAYDKVVNNQPRFGPEVKGRETDQVLQELTERLCTDDALLFDLGRYDEYGFNSWYAPGRRYSINSITQLSTLIQREQMVERLMHEIEDGHPFLITSEKAYGSWYYQQGTSPRDIPTLRVTQSAAKHSTLLVYTSSDKGGTRRQLRLECGFQPTQLR